MLKKTTLVKTSLIVLVFAAGYALGSFNVLSGASTDVIPEANAGLKDMIDCPSITSAECYKVGDTGDRRM